MYSGEIFYSPIHIFVFHLYDFHNHMMTHRSIFNHYVCIVILNRCIVNKMSISISIKLTLILSNLFIIFYINNMKRRVIISIASCNICRKNILFIVIGILPYPKIFIYPSFFFGFSHKRSVTIVCFFFVIRMFFVPT